MKRLEYMTKEELQEFARIAVQAYVNNSHILGTTPFYNVSDDILNQLTNYSRN